MANHKSAEKALRQTERRTEEKRSYQNAVRTFVRKVELALTSKNKEEATNAFKIAESYLMKGVTKKLHHKNTAARKVSRLSKRVKAL